jgi:hypothetical protein
MYYHHWGLFVQPTPAPSLESGRPVYPVVTEGESRGCTGVSQGPPRLHHASLKLHHLHLTLDTCKQRE